MLPSSMVLFGNWIVLLDVYKYIYMEVLLDILGVYSLAKSKTAIVLVDEKMLRTVSCFVRTQHGLLDRNDAK